MVEAGHESPHTNGLCVSVWGGVRVCTAVCDMAGSKVGG